MKEKNEKLKTSTLMLAARIIKNEKERMIKKYEIMKDPLSFIVAAQEARNSFHNDMRSSVRILNGLPIMDNSFLDNGYLLEEGENPRYSFLYNGYAHRSILWNGRMNSEEVSGNVFKGRFLMNMLITIDLNFDTILSRELKYRGKNKDSKEEIQLIIQIRDCIGNFIEKISNKKEDYREELLKISELLVMGDEDSFKKSKKAFQVAIREIEKIEDIIHPGFLDGKKPSDDVIIQNMCLIAFVLGTGSSNVKHTFLAPEDITFKDYERMQAMIEVLGSCILKRRKEEYPEMYRWYIQSLPKRFYRFKDVNYNRELAEGCRALSFVDFYANSKGITKIISKMIY